MKLKLLILGLIIGGFLYNGSGFAQTVTTSSKKHRPLIERVHRVKKAKKHPYKVKLKAKKKKKKKAPKKRS